MGRRFHAAAELPGEFFPGEFAEFCEGLIAVPHGVIFVGEASMIGGFKEGMMWDRSHVLAYEVFWWAEDGQGLRLVERFEEWAGDCPVRMSCLPGNRAEPIVRLLNRRGYDVSEIPMVKYVSH